ncbi:MAG: sigma-54-dependent Fis family transcriptional regulator [Sedimentisphaerales bacterium]|nr:sigma-54-dependent Fis family transcriptional regulator [Sedimentisphaerales bacterium]
MLLHIILVVDDVSLQKKLRTSLSRPDTIIETAKDHKRFLAKLGRKVCDLAVISQNLLAEDATEQIQKLKNSIDAPSVVILTEQDNEQERVRFIAAGCDAVLSLELSINKLSKALNAILQRRKKIARAVLTVPRQVEEADISDFAAKSPAMAKFVKMLPRIAKADSSVLLLGETGVGKERVAHVIHRESLRNNCPFIAIHCGALPESLLESELFGHEQGAFTGATKSRRGCFELAHQGTIFLDEIGEIPLHLQSKLLRVLESHEIRRVGGEKSIPVDVRVMAATNRDLEEEVKTKQFRKDLYYRLNVVSLTIPPLRERTKDIPELVESYIEYLGPRIGCPVTDIEEDALDVLCKYSWPGNVRELINIIERAMLLCENDMITTEDLPQSIIEPEILYEAGTWPDEMMGQPLKKARKNIVESFERNYFTALLHLTEGRVGKAAKKAGIDTRSLYEKMKKYDLNKKDFRPQE